RSPQLSANRLARPIRMWTSGNPARKAVPAVNSHERNHNRLCNNWQRSVVSGVLAPGTGAMRVGSGMRTGLYGLVLAAAGSIVIHLEGAGKTIRQLYLYLLGFYYRVDFQTSFASTAIISHLSTTGRAQRCPTRSHSESSCHS